MIDAVAHKIIYVDSNTREGGCEMEQLLSSMELPDCDFKLNCVEEAYHCENTGRPIVTTRGRAEKKYRAAVLRLVKSILEKEEDKRRRDDENETPKKGFFSFLCFWKKRKGPDEEAQEEE